MEPRVSFFVPCYNYGRFVAQAIDSLLGQTFQSLEVIVIDDASTDDSRQVLGRYQGDSRVRLIHHRQNRGFVASANEGIALSRGEYVALMDADDYCLRPDAVSRQVAVLDAHPDVGFVHAAHVLVDVNGTPKSVNRPRATDYIRDGLEEFADIVRMNYVQHSGTLRRRSCHQALGGYRADLPHGYAIDWDLWLRLATRYGVGYIAEPLYAYRIHGTNMSGGSVPPGQAIDELLSIVDRNFALVPTASEVRSQWDVMRRKTLFTTVWSDLAYGRARRAWWSLAAMLRRSPGLLADRQLYTSGLRILILTVLGRAHYQRMYGGFAG